MSVSHCALRPSTPADRALRGGHSPCGLAGTEEFRTAGYVKWQPGIQPFKRLSRREPENRSCPATFLRKKADPRENRTSALHYISPGPAAAASAEN